jgi:hypothetical protein
MLKLLVYWLCITLLSCGLTSVASAQVAVEYGIIGSKPPPKAPDTGKTISKKVEAGLKKTPSSDQDYKRQTQRQQKAGGKTGGPLIIERRGDHYERIN